MSRIHDALKKAAEEKTSRGAAGIASDYFDVEGELHRPELMIEAAQAVVQRDAQQLGSPSPVRFEELLKRCSHPTWSPGTRINVFNDEENKKNGAECFRTLRSRLHQIAGTRTLKRILVTSSIPAEGKTFVTANLAQSITRQPDRRVLAIDADLRASRLHLQFGAPATPGLTEYLKGETDEYSVIQDGAAGKLCLIPGGCEVANPSELLLSERMKRLLDLVTPLFDFVILDSPPTVPVHDASLLADLCDGTLLVVRAGVTDFEIASRAAVGFEGKNLLGVVLNGVGPEATYGKYYTNYYGSSDE